jgi:arylsulfatase A-like enzyme
MAWRLSSFCLFLALLTSAVVHAEVRHVLLLQVDDWGYADRGGTIDTPHLDAFFDDSATTRLPVYYSWPRCTGSRAMLMTGKYAHRNGLQNDVINFTNPHGIDARRNVGLANVVKAAFAVAASNGSSSSSSSSNAREHRSYYIGKWHTGHWAPAAQPSAFGYEHSYGFPMGIIGGHNYSANYTVTQRYANGTLEEVTWRTRHLYRNGRVPVPSDERLDMYELDALYAELMAEVAPKLNDSTTTTTFVHFSPFSVHGPYKSTAPAPWGTQYLNSSVVGSHSSDAESRQIYAGRIAYLDYVFGLVRQLYESRGVWNSTIVIVASDNGGSQWVHGVGNNYPLRGGKTTPYEGGVRCQAAVRIPTTTTTTTAVHNYTGLMSSVDLMPTLFGLITSSSVPVPVDATTRQAVMPDIDGVDLSAALRGDAANCSAPQRTLLLLYWDEVESVYVARDERYKLICGKMTNDVGWTGVPDVEFYAPPGSSSPKTAKYILYDLIDDERETDNLLSGTPFLQNSSPPIDFARDYGAWNETTLAELVNSTTVPDTTLHASLTNLLIFLWQSSAVYEPYYANGYILPEQYATKYFDDGVYPYNTWL